MTVQNIQADKGGQQIAADLSAIFVNYPDTIAVTVKGIEVSNQWARERKDELNRNRITGLKTATDAYYIGRP